MLAQEVFGAWRIFRSSASRETSRTAPGDPGEETRARYVTFEQLDLGRILWGSPVPTRGDPVKSLCSGSRKGLGGASSGWFRGVLLEDPLLGLAMEVTVRVHKRGGEGSI